jgi:hypothetical protein
LSAAIESCGAWACLGVAAYAQFWCQGVTEKPVDEGTPSRYARTGIPDDLERVATMTANLATDQTSSAAEQPTGELMSVYEAIARFRGEWVLMKVTEYDEDRWPSHGYVIAHSRDRDEINEAIPWRSQETILPDAPRQPYYVFLAYPRARSLAEYVAMSNGEDSRQE